MMIPFKVSSHPLFSVLPMLPVKLLTPEVLGIVSIFTYGMKRGLERIAAANTENHSLCNLDVLVDVAEEEGRIGPGWKERILAFRDNPSDESWIK